MRQDLLKHSLKTTLLQNRVRVKMLTKNLMGISIIICIALVGISLKQNSNEVLFIAIPISIYTIYACYQISKLWRTRKKTKQQLKTFQ